MIASTLKWRVTYGAYRATGQSHDYLVSRYKIAYAAFYRPRSDNPHDPYMLLPYSSLRRRREAQRVAEAHETKLVRKS